MDQRLRRLRPVGVDVAIEPDQRTRLRPCGGLSSTMPQANLQRAATKRQLQKQHPASGELVRKYGFGPEQPALLLNLRDANTSVTYEMSLPARLEFDDFVNEVCKVDAGVVHQDAEDKASKGWRLEIKEPTLGVGHYDRNETSPTALISNTAELRAAIERWNGGMEARRTEKLHKLTQLALKSLSGKSATEQVSGLWLVVVVVVVVVVVDGKWWAVDGGAS